MGKKILALDLDGTLTNSQKEITPKTRDAIRQIQLEGHLVVLASGRPTPGVVSIAKTLELEKYGGYMLSYNGAQITNCTNGQVLFQQTMPQYMLPKLFELADELQIGMITYQSEGIIANHYRDEYVDLEARINGLEVFEYSDPVPVLRTSVNKCLGTANPNIAPRIEQIFDEIYGGYISVGRSEPFFIELTPLGVDKAASMEKFRYLMGCEREDIIAVGDGFNDQSMIEYAGIGVAMANAQQIVKEAADYVTENDNDHDGVAEVIERFILS